MLPVLYLNKEKHKVIQFLSEMNDLVLFLPCKLWAYTITLLASINW